MNQVRRSFIENVSEHRCASCRYSPFCSRNKNVCICCEHASMKSLAAIGQNPIHSTAEQTEIR